MYIRLSNLSLCIPVMGTAARSSITDPPYAVGVTTSTLCSNFDVICGNILS